LTTDVKSIINEEAGGAKLLPLRLDVYVTDGIFTARKNGGFFVPSVVQSITKILSLLCIIKKKDFF
jgi:hypothetical protein